MIMAESIMDQLCTFISTLEILNVSITLSSFGFQVVKKNVIENIIPIVIALKHKLEESKSPLIDDLMNCLRELMKDYKNEVKDMLAADKQLASEIEFDLKKWEEDQKKIEETRREQVGRLRTVKEVWKLEL